MAALPHLGSGVLTAGHCAVRTQARAATGDREKLAARAGSALTRPELLVHLGKCAADARETLSGQLSTLRMTQLQSPFDASAGHRELTPWRPGTVRRLWLACLFVSVGLAALQAWSLRHEPADSDAVSYLDIGDALVSGDLSTGINSYWSPLYPLVVGATRAALHPSAADEYAVARVANFVIFLLALASFEVLLREVQRSRLAPATGTAGRATGLPPWAWLLTGYPLFLWTSLDVVGLARIGPDLAVAAIVYLTSAILLRIRRREVGAGAYALLGALLGLGYWVKTPMFPLALVILALAAFTGRTRIRHIMIAWAVFAAVCSPLVAVLSERAGRLSFGESAFLNYAWYVKRVPSRHWQGSPDTGVPAHPMHQLMARPEVYEFGRELPVTYPLWHDPGYWYEGLRFSPDVSSQLRKTVSVVLHIVKLFLGLSGTFAFGLFILLVVGWRSQSAGLMAAQWPLLVPSLAAFAMYSMVHVESRHVAAFITLAYLGGFSGVVVGEGRADLRVVAAVAAGIAGTFLLPIGPAYSPRYYFVAHQPAPNPAWDAARGIAEFGLRPRDRVATTTYANLRHTAWARLLRVQISAEVYHRPGVTSGNSFWRASAPTQDSILRAFESVGAKLVVADDVPAGATPRGWTPVPGTDLFVHRFEAPSTHSEPGREGF